MSKGSARRPGEIAQDRWDAIFKKPTLPLTFCAAMNDGECVHRDCPQLRDNEPYASGRHCPLDTYEDE